MSWQNLKAVIIKELRHILRNKGTLFLVTLSPILILFVMAYGMTADIEHVPIAVLDLDRSPTSRAFVQQITLGEDLDLYRQVESDSEIEDLLLNNEIKAAVTIGPTFEEDLFAMRGLPIQVLIDGTEPESGGYALEHITRRAEAFITQKMKAHLQALGLSVDTLNPLDLRLRTWFNPTLEARIDIIPGLISMILAFPGISVALSLSREREHGTLEQLLATPIQRGELLLGKIIPYIIVGLIDVPLTTLLAKYWFNVPFNGNFWLYMALSATFFFALLSMEMLVGVFIPSQAASLAVSFLLVFFPGFFLTGIFFPLVSMPDIARIEAMALPGTHYGFITRGAFVTGAGLEILWPYGLALVGMGILFTVIGAVFFKKKLG